MKLMERVDVPKPIRVLSDPIASNLCPSTGGHVKKVVQPTRVTRKKQPKKQATRSDPCLLHPWQGRMRRVPSVFRG